jgi:hypothetical protein
MNLESLHPMPYSMLMTALGTAPTRRCGTRSPVTSITANRVIHPRATRKKDHGTSDQNDCGNKFHSISPPEVVGTTSLQGKHDSRLPADPVLFEPVDQDMPGDAARHRLPPLPNIRHDRMVSHQSPHIKKQPLCRGRPHPYIHWKSITYTIFLEYGAIESCGGWRIVFDAKRHFFKPMWAIGFYFREDAGFASGETIKVDRVVDGSGKMCL